MQHEDRGEDEDRENEIGDRACRNDGRALSKALMMEALAPLGRRHGGGSGSVGRRAGDILIAEEFDVTAERHGRNLPAGAVTIVEAHDFGAEPDREHHDPHPAQARDREMSELVEKHHDRQDEQERQDPAGKAAPPHSKTFKEAHQPEPVARPWKRSKATDP